RIEVEKALAETDTSDLRASLRRTLSFSIPQPTLYLNYPGAYSDLIFGVPLVDLTTNRDNVPKVMRMCIEEVDKRGLDAEKIYSVSWSRHVLGFMFSVTVCDKSFSFNSTDDIYSVATLLRRYLWDLPEPLFILSLRDYRQYKYRQNGGKRYTENDLSLLRSKIRELPLVHRASLRFLLQHLSRVASHSDKNGMTVTALAAHFRNPLLRGHAVLQDGVDVKACCVDSL
ncbi:Rho GTPase activation protein, partial [Lactarius psammicola]